MKSKAMEYINLSKSAQAAARRISKRTGETPEEVARRTASIFFKRARYTADLQLLGLCVACAGVIIF